MTEEELAGGRVHFVLRLCLSTSLNGARAEFSAPCSAVCVLCVTEYTLINKILVQQQTRLAFLFPEM